MHGLFVNCKSLYVDGLTAALQVVELPREGPEAALKLFGGLPNLRLLVIGGDGTVAWILSCIDSIQVCPYSFCQSPLLLCLWLLHITDALELNCLCTIVCSVKPG